MSWVISVRFARSAIAVWIAAWMSTFVNNLEPCFTAVRGENPALIAA